MNMHANLKSPVLPNHQFYHLIKRRNKMNTKLFSARKGSDIGIGFLFVLLAALALSSCASKARAEGASCSIDMNMRVTINVTDVKPQAVFDQLARDPDCAITVSPFVRKHVTLHMENAKVFEVLARVCSQIECKYILNENHLAIQPLTLIDKLHAKQWEEFDKYMAERRRILQSLLPEDMTFEDVPLSTVLKEISKVSGLDIKSWKDEGDRKVTIDVSGMTVDEALKAVVLYVDGEGAVLIEQKYFLHHSWSQYWLWGYPPSY
jgi:hypothetical protein